MVGRVLDNASATPAMHQKSRSHFCRSSYTEHFRLAWKLDLSFSN